MDQEQFQSLRFTSTTPLGPYRSAKWETETVIIVGVHSNYFPLNHAAASFANIQGLLFARQGTTFQESPQDSNSQDRTKQRPRRLRLRLSGQAIR